MPTHQTDDDLYDALGEALSRAVRAGLVSAKLAVLSLDQAQRQLQQRDARPAA